MKKAIMWGCGYNAIRLYHFLNLEEVDVLGFTDNSGKKEVIEDFMFGIPYLPVNVALDQEIDFFIIGSLAYCDITSQLISCGITRDRIIQAYNVQFMIPDTMYFYNDVETDESKYKVFKSIDCFSCKRM